LWITLSPLVTTPGQCPRIIFGAKEKKKAIKDKITKITKGKNGLGKNASMAGVSALYTPRRRGRNLQSTRCVLGGK
jgi:hypothetical protein